LCFVHRQSCRCLCAFAVQVTRLILFFILYVSFFSLLFYLASLFWNKEATSRNALLFRDFLINIKLSAWHPPPYLWDPPSCTGLIVANHRSYFDPIIMLNHTADLSVGEKGSRIMAAHRIPAKFQE
jgi:1-acyl-sn-glycerol-3-phosphate acyltransferase